MTSLKYNLDKLQMLKPTPGLTGLRNIGNTCFLNSIVQCLSNTRHLRYYIISNGYKKDIRGESQGDLIIAFANLLKEIWSGTTEVANTTLFKSQVQRFAPRFMGHNQQDAQEFLRYLLEGLHKDVNSADKKQRRNSELLDDLPEPEKAIESWNQYLTHENSFVVNLFVGQLKSTLTFANCGHRSTTYEVFWDISLPLPVTNSSNLQLSDCFEHFMEDETLDGENMAKCQRCNKRRPCTKRYSIHKFPRVLVVHLKRFSPTERFRKLNVNVNFPVEGLDLTAYSDNAKVTANQVMVYDLYAVSNHSGSTQYGHYTSTCKHPDTRQWHYFNDSAISALAAYKVVSPHAYVLFYEQRVCS